MSTITLRTATLAALLSSSGIAAAANGTAKLHELRASFASLSTQAQAYKKAHLTDLGATGFVGLGLGINAGILTKVQNGKATYSITVSPSLVTGGGIGAITTWQDARVTQDGDKTKGLPWLEKRTTKLEWGYPLGANAGEGTMKGLGTSKTTGHAEDVAVGFLAYKTRTERRVNVRLPFLRLPSKVTALAWYGNWLLRRADKALQKGTDRAETRADALLEEAEKVHGILKAELAE